MITKLDDKEMSILFKA